MQAIELLHDFIDHEHISRVHISTCELANFIYYSPDIYLMDLNNLNDPLVNPLMMMYGYEVDVNGHYLKTFSMVTDGNRYTICTQTQIAGVSGAFKMTDWCLGITKHDVRFVAKIALGL